MIGMQELADREAIRDCLFRFCRGIDRMDEEALRSAYWPDAIEDHGAYLGPVEGFVQIALRVVPTWERSIIQLHNILIEFRDAGARVESYFSGFQRFRDPTQTDGIGELHQKGRYVDWFEQRAGEWRIRNRVVVLDWDGGIPAQSDAPKELQRSGPKGDWFPHDPVYAKDEAD